MARPKKTAAPRKSTPKKAMKGTNNLLFPKDSVRKTARRQKSLEGFNRRAHTWNQLDNTKEPAAGPFYQKKNPGGPLPTATRNIYNPNPMQLNIGKADKPVKAQKAVAKPPGYTKKKRNLKGRNDSQRRRRK